MAAIVKTPEKAAEKPAEDHVMDWNGELLTELAPPLSKESGSWEDVPVKIRETIEQSRAEYDQHVTVAGKTLKPGTPKYRTFAAGSVTRAQEFVRLARMYARLRPEGPITIRAGISDEGEVRFAATPFKTRTVVK